MEGINKIEDEQIISAFLSEIRTIGDRALFMAFFTNHRIILVNLHSSNSIGVDMFMGPIYWGIRERTALIKVEHFAREAKYSLENILKDHKNIIEIRYDKIINIEYKYDEEYQTPYLKIYYPKPLLKSKSKINLVVLPDKPYREAIIKQGIKSGNLSIDFGEDILNILQPHIGDKLIMLKK